MAAPSRARLKAIQPVLAARDVESSIRFYERLGFAALFRDDPRAPRYGAVARDGCELHLQWRDASDWETPGDRPVVRFLVADVDRLYREFEAAGVVPDPTSPSSPWRTPEDTPWGTREFHLRDPAGNGLQFYRPL